MNGRHDPFTEKPKSIWDDVPERSTRSTLDEELRAMPEAALLDNVYDEKERAVLESQLRALHKERKRKRLLEKPNVKLPARDHFTVYDCTSDDAVHKPLSLLEPESCGEIELTHRSPVNVTVQVLQTGSRISVTAFRCSLTMSREVTRCGQFAWHNYLFSMQMKLRKIN